MKNMCPTVLWHAVPTKNAGAAAFEFLKDTKFIDKEHVTNSALAC